ncbi:MAG TPA: YbhN family protein [Dehalococcoidia bacterium]|nr:YbhN family protein [Dehalococcoidia bacterium]
MRIATKSFVLLIVVGAAMYVLLPQLATIQRSTDVVRSLAWWAVLLAACAQCCCYLAHSYALGAILALFEQRLSLMRRLALTMAPYSLSLVWGGQLTSSTASFRWLRKAGVPAEAALVTGVLPAVINLLSFLGIATFGLAYLLSRRQVSQALVVALLVPALLLIAAVAVAWWIVGHRALVVAAAHRSGSFWARLRRRQYDPGATEAVLDSLFDAWSLLLAGGWLKAVAGDAMSVVFDLLTLYCVFWAAGYSISPGLLLAGYGLPNLAGKLSILPGGVGVVEGSMAALYAALGVSGSIVVVVTLGYRLLSFWIPVALGFVFAIWLDHTLPLEAPDLEPS